MKKRAHIRRLAWALACIMTVTSVPAAGTAVYAAEECFSDGMEAVQEFSDSSENEEAVIVDIPAEEAELFSAEEVELFSAKETIVSENETVVDTGLSVESNYNVLTLPVGEGTDLVVKASIKEGFGSISYEWYKAQRAEKVENVLLEGENTSVLHVDGSKPGGTYYCVVKDTYGNKIEVAFWVNVDNGFWSESSLFSKDVKKGEAIDLTPKVSVKEGTLFYQWYVLKKAEDGSEQCVKLDGEDGKILHISAVQERSSYRCLVQDNYGNGEYIDFDLDIDTSLELEQYHTVEEVSAGEDLNLTVKASVEEEFGPLYYQWYYQDAELGDILAAEGTNLNTYHLSAVSKNCSYVCNVTDTIGNTAYAYFDVRINSGLQVEEEENISKTVLKGTEEDLVVHASITEGYGEITYEWYKCITDGGVYKEEILEGETTNTLHVSIQENCQYGCTISDAYGNRKYVNFKFSIDNGFKVETQDTKVYAKLGGNVDLAVKVSAYEPPAYQWFYKKGDHSELLEEKTGTLHLTNVQERGEYYCTISDNYGNYKSVTFDVCIDSGLKIDTENMKTTYFVKAGDRVTLKLLASAEHNDGLSYAWYKEDIIGRRTKLQGENDSITIVDFRRGYAYVGVVSDRYDEKEVTFHISVLDYENAIALSETQELMHYLHVFQYYKVKAAKEGKYTFFSKTKEAANIEGYLLDAEGNVIAESKGNPDFEIQKEMHAGDVYYLAVKPEKNGICEVCMKVEKKHEHSWSKWSVTKAATYTKKGVEARECEGCGKKETREIKCKTIPTPKLVSAKATGSSKITVNWKAVSGVAGYRVYRKTGNGSYTSLKDVTGKTSYVDTTAKSGVTYTYTVKAYCKDGNKKFYSSYNKTGKSAVTKAKAPTLVSAAVTSQNKITFKWQAVSGVDGYRVYRKTGSGSYKKLADVSKNKTSYVDSTVKLGVVYTYTVKAYHKTGSGEKRLGYYSEKGKTVTARATAPTLSGVSALGSGKVKVSWKKLSNVDGYQVCRKTKNGSWKVIGTVSFKASSYTDKTAKKGVTYYYTVRAYNNNKGCKVLGFYDTKGKSIKVK